MLERIDQGPRAQAAAPRGAHHAVARRRRQGHADADRGGVPRRLPQPAAGAAGGRRVARRSAAGRLAFTTDSFVVSPLFFPGGDIGDLAVNGTVNDLAMCGARPLYLSCGFILEEGFPVADLQRIVRVDGRRGGRGPGCRSSPATPRSSSAARRTAATSTRPGSALLDRPATLAAAAARPGDAVLVSGPIGDHGITVMLARGELDIEADIVSDTAPLHGLIAALLDAVPGASGCCATPPAAGWRRSCNEVAAAAARRGRARRARGAGAARGAAARRELLGIDPLYVACEGRLVAVVDPATGPTPRWPRCGRSRSGRAPRVIGTVERRPARPGAAAHGVRRHPDRRPARRRPAAADLLRGPCTSWRSPRASSRRWWSGCADAPVRRVRLEIGRLSGVVPDAVRFCFDLVAAGTTLEGAVLEIDEPGGRVRAGGARRSSTRTT